MIIAGIAPLHKLFKEVQTFFLNPNVIYVMQRNLLEDECLSSGTQVQTDSSYPNTGRQQYCSNHFFSSPMFGHSMKTELESSSLSSARNFSASTSDIRESIPRSTKGAPGVSSEGSRPVSRAMIYLEVSLDLFDGGHASGSDQQAAWKDLRSQHPESR